MYSRLYGTSYLACSQKKSITLFKINLINICHIKARRVAMSLVYEFSEKCYRRINTTPDLNSLHIGRQQKFYHVEVVCVRKALKHWIKFWRLLETVMCNLCNHGNVRVCYNRLIERFIDFFSAGTIWNLACKKASLCCRKVTVPSQRFIFSML